MEGAKTGYETLLRRVDKVYNDVKANFASYNRQNEFKSGTRFELHGSTTLS